MIIKWRWAGHVARMRDNRWTVRVTDWILYGKKRNRGRPKKRWRDQLPERWKQQAQNRKKWKDMEREAIFPGG